MTDQRPLEKPPQPDRTFRTSRKREWVKTCLAILPIPILAYPAYWALAWFCSDCLGTHSLIEPLSELVDSIGEPTFCAIAVIGVITFPAYIALYLFLIRRRLGNTFVREVKAVIGMAITLLLVGGIATLVTIVTIRLPYWLWHRPIHDAAYVDPGAPNFSWDSVPDSDVDGAVSAEERKALEKCRAILEDSPGQANAKDENGRTPLHLTNNVHIARLLLQEAADVNATDPEGATPLHTVMKCGKSDFVELAAVFLQHGANVNARDKHGRTALH